MLSLEQVKNKVQNDLNALVMSLGFVDENDMPLMYFYGEVSTYDEYNWVKSIDTTVDSIPASLGITPFALVREASTPSSGELINERLEEYSVFCFIKASDKAMAMAVFEEYMSQENFEQNLTVVGNVKILKRLTNFVVGEQELLGAPDGEARHQFDLSLTYDMFESRLLTSKDYTVTIDGEQVSYISFRYEKSNMVIPNKTNATAGQTVAGIVVTDAMGIMHDVSIVFDFYMDSLSTAMRKITSDSTSLDTANRKFAVSIVSNDVNNMFSITQDMVINGHKLSNTLPQVSSIEVTFSLAYSRLGFRMKIQNGSYIDMPIFAGRIGNAAALKSAAYMHDNATRSFMIGGAKGVSLVIPILRSNTLVYTLVEETLKKVYTNKYVLEVTYLGIVVEYTVVMSESSIDIDNAAYDVLNVSFVEAK